MKGSARDFAPSALALLATALVAASGPLLWWLTTPRQPLPAAAIVSPPTPPAAPAATAQPAAASAPGAAPAVALAVAPAASTPRWRVREPDSDPTPDLADVLNPGETPTMPEVIARLRAAGVHSGLGAFQPPGTRPPLLGLAVPPDFELPPGYVRHHQATDDGQRIEAILMFAPDAVLRDAQGQPVPLPADRVVPPELAPPGLPLRRITVPPPVSPGR